MIEKCFKVLESRFVSTFWCIDACANRKCDRLQDRYAFLSIFNDWLRSKYVVVDWYHLKFSSNIYSNGRCIQKCCNLQVLEHTKRWSIDNIRFSTFRERLTTIKNVNICCMCLVQHLFNSLHSNRRIALYFRHVKLTKEWVRNPQILHVFGWTWIEWPSELKNIFESNVLHHAA